MGTTIEAASTSKPRVRLGGTGAIRLADDAARACLERARRSPSEIDFLINTGVYRDNNIGEPAVAAIIQEDIGANPDPPLEGGHGTFSFDICNGACGVLNGVHIIDGFLHSGAIKLGIVVASDADPSRGSHWDFPFGLVRTAGRLSRNHEDFPFAPIGGAVLLSHSEEQSTGFSRFAFATFSEFKNLLESNVTWHEGPIPRGIADRVPGLEPGRNKLQVQQDEGYAARCAECAASSSKTFLQSADLDPMDIDLLIPSPTPTGFPDLYAQAMGIPADRVARVGERFANVHTAGSIAALEGVMRTGQFQQARNVLFVTVGSGITVGLALYHP